MYLQLENKLQQNSMRDVWMCMKQITGSNTKDHQQDGSLVRAIELNLFINRFSTGTPTGTPSTGTVFTPCCHLLIPYCDPNPTPHCVCLFNLSLLQERTLVIWKTSCLLPVPKIAVPSGPSDFKPVALTSHVMKVLERLVLMQLRTQVKHNLTSLVCLLAACWGE